MTRIYTKTGDTGETSLFGGGRVRKDDARVDAYGEVDELNACLGMVRTHGPDAELDAMLQRIQDELFTVGSMLATPQDTRAYAMIPKIQPAWIEAMEKAIDTFGRGWPSTDAIGASPGTSGMWQLWQLFVAR